MNEKEDLETGQKLLNAVERIVESPEEIVRRVDDMKKQAAGKPVAEVRRTISDELISRYSTRSMISGGASSLPSMIPGFGTLVAVAGGTLVDMGLMLKFEVEMALSLSYLYGFDIRQEKERQIAFLLASVGTYEAKSGRNYFVDLAEAGGTAIWNYTPRQVSKFIVSVLAKIALLSISKGFARALPIVGVVVNSSMNKGLTTRVGRRCVEELERRRKIADLEANEEDVVDAKVRGDRRS